VRIRHERKSIDCQRNNRKTLLSNDELGRVRCGISETGGNLTVWFDKNAVQKYWKPEATGKRGASFQYSETAIQTLLTLKAVYSLPYRALEGFVRSLMSVMGLELNTPYAST
jgi:hypothetical protein